METSVFQNIQRSIQVKRQNLINWLSAAPASEREVRLGPEDEQAVQAHIRVLDSALDKIEEDALGICEVCHDNVDAELLEMDYTASVCLDHFSEEDRRQLETDLELSQVLQKALLPHRAPAIPGLDVAAFSRPAQIVGGDYFDFLRFRDGAHGLAIADAMGHGLSASLLMTGLQTSLRTLVPESKAPEEVLRRINHFYLHNVNFTTLITAFLGKFDPVARTLTYSNAGQNPPALYRAQQDQVAWLTPTGAAIGFVEDYEISAQSVSLAKGDVLLLYTDGVVEATNDAKEEFERERLEASVRQNAGLPAQEIVHAVRQSLKEFTGSQPLADDLTILACKVA